MRFTGALFLALGLGPSFMVIVALERRVGMPGTLISRAILPDVLVCAIAVFCLVFGARLLFRRPVLGGSILSPRGWAVLAGAFYAVAAAAAGAVAARGEHQLLVAALGFALLGYASTRARKASLIDLTTTRLLE